jgi:small subunit ribosomal protein S19
MSRSKWKGAYTELGLNRKINQYFLIIEQNPSLVGSHAIKVWRKSSEILPQYVGIRFEIHDGKTFKVFQVQSKHVGRKFGEFVTTKRSAVYPLEKKTKKKEKTRFQGNLPIIRKKRKGKKQLHRKVKVLPF